MDDAPAYTGDSPSRAAGLERFEAVAQELPDDDYDESGQDVLEERRNGRGIVEERLWG